jgi:NAD(P)-dependent dehydrogenase (short-subunit alcohol dehydrogenase family)
MDSLAGKIAVVTGAGSGIGRALALAVARRGMSVALSDIQADPLRETEGAIAALGVRTIAVRADVSRSADIATLAARAWAELGPVHLLFNNAGVGGKGGLLWEGSPDDWEWTLGANLWGVVHGIEGVEDHSPLLAACKIGLEL